MAQTRQPCLPCTSCSQPLGTLILRKCRVSTLPSTRQRPVAFPLVEWESCIRHCIRRTCNVSASSGSGDGAAVSPLPPSELVALTGSLEVEEPAPLPPKTRVQKARELANRVFFGLLLGLSGAVVILYGKLAMLALLVFVAYQASREYFGFMSSKQMSKGMPPPPPLVSAATTAMCAGIAVFSHFYHGKSGTVLAVAAFLLLVIQVVVNKRPKFSQLASSLFGLFYCGERGRGLTQSAWSFHLVAVPTDTRLAISPTHQSSACTGMWPAHNIAGYRH